MSEVAEKRLPPVYYNIKTMQTRGCCGHTLSCARGVVFGACSIINAPNYIMFSAPVCAKTRQHAARRHCVCVCVRAGVGFNHSTRQPPDSHSFGAK
jgi:hypothetical protein